MTVNRRQYIILYIKTFSIHKEILSRLRYSILLHAYNVKILFETVRTFGAIFATFSLSRVLRILRYFPRSIKPPAGTLSRASFCAFFTASGFNGLCLIEKK